MLHVLPELIHHLKSLLNLELTKSQYSEVVALVEETTQLHQAQFAQRTAELIHEISNPLTVVMLNLDLIKTDPAIRSHFELKDRVDILEYSLEQLKQILRHAQPHLQSSREHQRFLLNQELTRLIAFIEPKAQQNRITLLFSPKIEYELKGSSIRFGQVMFNLILNALDAYSSLQQNHQLTPRIAISTSSQTQKCYISVRDWGPGISPSELKHIFKPFYTTKSHTPSHSRGIGLYLAKKIIETEFKGRLTVQSQLGKGTCFLIELPQMKTVMV